MNDVVVGECVLSSRIAQPKLGAEARVGHFLFYSGDLPKHLTNCHCARL